MDLELVMFWNSKPAGTQYPWTIGTARLRITQRSSLISRTCHMMMANSDSGPRGTDDSMRGCDPWATAQVFFWFIFLSFVQT